jgi:ankyrin repeat protein
MLLKHGDDVSAHKNLGLTPSLLAFRSGNVEVVQILLEYGAEATARDGHKVDSALHLALQWGCAVACVFLEHSADVMAQDKDGLTPFRMALGGRHGKVARLLLRNGADAGSTGHYVSYRFRNLR